MKLKNFGTNLWPTILVLISTDRFLGKRIDNFGKSLNRLVRVEFLNTMTWRSMKR